MDRMDEELIRRNLPDFPGLYKEMQWDKERPCPEQKNSKALSAWEEGRKTAIELLCSSFYGYIPFGSYEIKFETGTAEEDGFGGKAVVRTIIAVVQVYGKAVCFPFQLALPKKKEKVPVFLYLGFTADIADGVGEWVIEEGYGIAHVYYQDMAADYPDSFKSGLGRLGCRNSENSAGKLAVWAFGLSRVADYLMKCEEVDQKRIGVMGHSRLGKTALAAGAFDERFSLTAAVQSGAAGAALFRGKKGEQLTDLNKTFSHDWLCGRAYEYMDKVEKLPFDQHFLPCLTAPRHLYIGSAQRDFWADPLSEYLSCVAGSKAYEWLGSRGLVREREAEEYLFLEESGQASSEYKQGLIGKSHKGEIGWHYRYGTHYLSILDWKEIMEYRKLHNV